MTAFGTFRLDEVAEILQGGRLKLSAKHFVQVGYPAFGAGGHNGDLATYEFERDGLVLGTIGTCGKCYVATGRWTSLANTQVIFPCVEKVELRYLWYLLNDPSRWYVSGTSQKFIKPSEVKGHRVTMPLLIEQRRIVQVLDRAQLALERRRESLRKCDALAVAMFKEAVERSKAPSVPIGELVARGDLLVHKDGNHGSLYPRSDEFGDEGVPFLSAKAVRDDGRIDGALVEHLRMEKASQLRHGWIQPGDVLLAHNASVGKVARYDGALGSALVGTSLTVFRPNPDRIDSWFLEGALRSDAFQRQLAKNMAQTTRSQVPITAQRTLTVPLPETSIQAAYAQRRVSLEKVVTLCREAAQAAGSLCAALRYRALAGEL